MSLREAVTLNSVLKTSFSAVVGGAAFYTTRQMGAEPMGAIVMAFATGIGGFAASDALGRKIKKAANHIYPERRP